MAFTVEFQEEDTYPRSLWTGGTFVGNRQLICAWSDRVTLLEEIDTWPNNKWPYPDGPSDALADRVATEGIGKQTNASGTTAEYAQARLKVRYTNSGPVGFNNGATLISERMEVATQTHATDEEWFRWDNNAGQPLSFGEAPVLIEDNLVYVVQFHRALAVPNATISRMGTVNSNVVGTWLLGLSFAAETLKYKGASILTKHTLGRLLTYDVTYRYRYRSVGWNVFWRASTASYEPIYLAGGARYRPYPLAVY